MCVRLHLLAASIIAVTHAASSFRITTGALVDQRYLLLEELGSGGVGVVYKARHIALDAFVAIKMLRPEYACEEELAMCLREEARLAACLRSDHVVRVLDVGELDSGVAYVVLEYVEGHDLETELAHCGRLPLNTVVRYALDICAALSEAHSRGVVHGDIKPENLLIERLGDGTTRIKVADFGSAKRILRQRGALIDPGGYVGTPRYMAPEQILDSREVDARADIWSLGVVLYEMLTDRLPFAGAMPHEVHAHVLRGKVMPPRALRAEVPAALERIVLKCLEKDLVRRYPDVGELVLDIQALGMHGDGARAESVVRRLGAVRVSMDG